MELGLFVVLLIVVAVVSSIRSSIAIRKENRQRLIKEYNEPLKRELSYDAFTHLKNYFYMSTEGNTDVIDDDTWDDLDMDSIYMEMNNTNSSVGREYLYAMLRKPVYSQKELDDLEVVVKGFMDNENSRIKIQEHFLKGGKLNDVSVYEYITEIVNMEKDKNLIHYLSLLGIGASLIIMLFVNPGIGTFLFIAAITFAIISYYKYKAKFEAYLSCVKNIVKMIICSKKIISENSSFLSPYCNELKDITLTLKEIPKNMFLISSGSGMSGSLAEVVLDYIRILTHMDLIKFNRVVDIIKKNEDKIKRMYEICGYIESCIAIGAYRNKLQYWSYPEFEKGGKYSVVDVFHPLLSKPVPNSINAKKSVLLTGSNASGKSTFLKTIAINALLSQTINTSVSKEYKGDFVRIVSSMSHRDDIINGDSYYMVEIKALKRIVDLAEDKEHKMLVFLDEVLRGTNTVERIAASTQILKQFAMSDNAVCFAATHDIELTLLLSDYYNNYHFDESFEENDVKYNYKIIDGPAVTRNAIKLLRQIGFNQTLIKEAEEMTKFFEENGAWGKL